MDELGFAVTQFKRIYDVEPKQDVLTLEELKEGLMRFVLRPELQKRFLRAKRRNEKAWDAWQKGEHIDGKQWTYLARAKRKALREGQDVDEAIRAKYKKMQGWARDEIKGDVRVWSPTFYPEGAPKRGTVNVTHVSCLVLDYDKGLPMEEATSDWSSWYHIVHTTWSHTWESHRFRLILPLANPVFADDWPKVWDWAEQRAGQQVDPAPSSPGNIFVLPVVPDPDWPRHTYLHGGALLDPVVKGLVREVPLPPFVKEPAEDSHFRGGQEDKEFITGSNADDWDAAFDNPY